MTDFRPSLNVLLVDLLIESFADVQVRSKLLLQDLFPEFEGLNVKFAIEFEVVPSLLPSLTSVNSGRLGRLGKLGEILPPFERSRHIGGGCRFFMVRKYSC